jgi:hypothetical protein
MQKVTSNVLVNINLKNLTKIHPYHSDHQVDNYIILSYLTKHSEFNKILLQKVYYHPSKQLENQLRKTILYALKKSILLLMTIEWMKLTV